MSQHARIKSHGIFICTCSVQRSLKGVEFQYELATVCCEGQGGTDHGGDRNWGETAANKHVAEVLKRQWLGQLTRMYRGTQRRLRRRLGSKLLSMEWNSFSQEEVQKRARRSS